MMREVDSLSLTCGRRDLPRSAFGFIGRNFCDECKGFDEGLNYHMTHRQTWDQPEEGVESCPHCGSRNCGENEEDHAMKVIRRYSIHRKYRGVA